MRASKFEDTMETQEKTEWKLVVTGFLGNEKKIPRKIMLDVQRDDLQRDNGRKSNRKRYYHVLQAQGEIQSMQISKEIIFKTKFDSAEESEFGK